MAEEEGKKLRTLTARVVSSKMDKTAGVVIERMVRHPLYGKFVRRSTRLLVHDAENQCKEGDVVSITPCRPLSKRKAWRVVSIVERLGS